MIEWWPPSRGGMPALPLGGGRGGGVQGTGRFGLAGGLCSVSVGGGRVATTLRGARNLAFASN